MSADAVLVRSRMSMHGVQRFSRSLFNASPATSLLLASDERRDDAVHERHILFRHLGAQEHVADLWKDSAPLLFRRDIPTRLQLPL